MTMKKYQITSVRELRKSFWAFCDDLGGANMHKKPTKRNILSNWIIV